MSTLIGAIRVTLFTIVLLLGAVVVLIAALIPGRYLGARWSAWCCTFIARAFNRIFGVRVNCTDPARLVRHRGLIFPNHSSFLDPLALMTTSPVRWLAATEVQRRPVIGWIGNAIDTVYVDRTDKTSRRAARHSVSTALQTNPFPAIVIFPEGKLDPGVSLYPFRYGAFDMAVENEVAFLPVALQYNRPDITTWYGGLRNEHLYQAVWRLATHLGRISINVIPLDEVQPTKADSSTLLAATTQRAIEQALNFTPAPTS